MTAALGFSFSFSFSPKRCCLALFNVENTATRLPVQCLLGGERELRNESKPECVVGWLLADLS